MIRARRRKTGAIHRVPLWPKSMAAILALGVGPADDLVFKTEKGKPVCYNKTTRDAAGVIVRVSGCDSVKLLWQRICEPVLDYHRPGIGFYLLRHTHRSLSGGAKDEGAADVVAGHDQPGMRKVYEHITPDRLRAVTEHVRGVVLRRPSRREF
jgi:integrase